MKYCFIILIFLNAHLAYSNPDSTVSSIVNKLEQLDTRVEQIKRDQLNYLIEKDLIKETYSNNYDRINIFLTFILGLFGLLSFLGFRDVNTIKKEYKEELEKLRTLQTTIESKSTSFELAKKKYDEEIEKIVNQNEEQNKKIKALELKEKIIQLYSNNNFNDAMEYCVIALELDPTNVALLLVKAAIYSKRNDYSGAMDTYEKVLSIGSKDFTAVANLTELYYAAKLSDKAKLIREKYAEVFTSRREVSELLDVFEAYNLKDVESFIDLVIEKIDKEDMQSKRQRIQWDFSEYEHFLSKESITQKRKIVEQYIQYLKGITSAEDAIKGIQQPKV